MTERITPARTCGIVGGILFAAVAAYNLYLYIMLLMREGASLNFMTLLTVAESAAIGVLAVLNKRGRLLETVAWIEAVHGFFSIVILLLNVMSATMINSVAFTLVLSSVIGGAASVLLAGVLIIGSCRQGQVRWVRRFCFLPALALLAGAAVSFTVAEINVANLAFVALQGTSALLVCLWVTAPAPAAPEFAAEDAVYPAQWQ